MYKIISVHKVTGVTTTVEEDLTLEQATRKVMQYHHEDYIYKIR